MKSVRRLTILILAVAAVKLSGAATYTGTVLSVSGDIAKVAMNGDVMPRNGARAEIFFKIAGGDDEISVATGSALKIDQGDMLVKIEDASGTVEKGQLVRFTSSAPGQTESPAPETTQTSTPTEAHGHFLEGVRKMQARDWRGAIVSFTKALELDPTDAKSMANRGSVYIEMKQPKRALPDLNEAIRLSPDLSMAYVIRGHCYSDLGQLKRAREDYDEAIRLDPKNAQAHNARGIIHIHLKQPKIAIEDLSQAITLDPGFVEAYQNRATSYKAVGKSQLAKQDLARVRELQDAAKTNSSPKPGPP